MNHFYQNWLEMAKIAASNRGLEWNPLFNRHTGKIDKVSRWNLTILVGLSPPPQSWLSSFAHIDDDLTAIEHFGLNLMGLQKPSLIMSRDWQEFYKAVMIHELIIKKNSIQHACINMKRPIFLLSACSGDMAPWELNAETVQRGYNIALRIGESGKVALNFRMLIRSLLDKEHLANNSPLHEYCLPFPDSDSLDAQKLVEQRKLHQGSNHNVHTKRSELSSRKSPERLPELEAFWELIRIVFTEPAKTFADHIRFAVLKLQIITGMRIGESVMLPLDCIRWREYFDTTGAPAGASGGITRSLQLRYFAEKQEGINTGSTIRLVENFQDVPQIFEKLTLETIDEVKNLTTLLRKRLKHQTETGRILPEYTTEDVVSAIDLFTHLTGSPCTSGREIPLEIKEAYRRTYSIDQLNRIRQFYKVDQKTQIEPVLKYWSPLLKKESLIARDFSGSPRSKLKICETYFRISEVESLIRNKMPTKLSDTLPFTGSDGESVYPFQLLFLYPSRCLIEGRNGGFVDVEKYFSIGRIDSSDLILQLSNVQNGLFSRYGKTAADRSLSLNTHALRHLQNAELFRLGVADTIITKRFGRKSTAQSHTYDHRSLSEDLASIELPGDMTLLPERTQDTLRLINSGKLRGPIVDEFLRIQLELGDQVAFEYLAAEADGLHVTPYGFCLSSFTVDPCPKHLECFNGCRHLARSNLPEERNNLELLKDRMNKVLVAAESAPVKSAGKTNQIRHVKDQLKNIDLAIAAEPGTRVFPEGADLSVAINSPKTLIDHGLIMTNKG